MLQGSTIFVSGMMIRGTSFPYADSLRKESVSVFDDPKGPGFEKGMMCMGEIGKERYVWLPCSAYTAGKPYGVKDEIWNL